MPYSKEISDLAGRYNLAAFVETAMLTGMMRTHHFPAVRAFAHGRRTDRIVSATHIAFGRTGFSLWNCHIISCIHNR